MKIRIAIELDADEMEIIRKFYNLRHSPSREQVSLYLADRIEDHFREKVSDNEMRKQVDANQLDAFDVAMGYESGGGCGDGGGGAI